MPNWCENYVEVTGPRKVMDKLAEALEEQHEEGLFRTILDYITPVEEQVTNKLVGEDDSNWYSNNIENYGTKWDVTDVPYEGYEPYEEDGKWEASFETAWSPPIAIFDNLAETLDIRVKIFYLEEGMGFAGIFDSEEIEGYMTDDVSEADDIPEALENCFDIECRMEEYREECA